MDPLAYPIFSGISAWIRKDFFEAMNGSYTKMVESIVAIAIGIETIIIIRYGFIIMGRQTTEDEREPDVEELMYHLLVVAGVLTLLQSGQQAIDFIMALRSIVISGLTGSDMPGGQQIDQWLTGMNAAMSLGNFFSSLDSTYVSSIKSSMVTMALTFTVSPQITGALLLLFNEVMTRFGMGIFPLAAYAALYKTTRDVFVTWLGLMVALTVLMATSAVTIQVMTTVSAIFAAVSAGVSAYSLSQPVGAWYISEIQQALIQSGFGFTLTIIILNFPVNAANFAGGYIMFAGPSLNNELGALYKNDRRSAFR